MNVSIRKFLLINLLLAIAATTLLSALGIFSLEQKEVRQHMDGLLVYAAISIQVTLKSAHDPSEISKLQDKATLLSDTLERYRDFKILTATQRQYIHNFVFQVWDKDDNLIIMSPDAPARKLSEGAEGFLDKKLEGIKWHSFTSYDAASGLTVIAAENTASSTYLQYRMALNEFLIVIFTFPIAGFFIWIIIGRGLKKLNQIAQTVSERDPNHLESMSLESAPAEIIPIIKSLNQLFASLADAFERQKRFSGDAAHELRTPLAALKTQAQVAMNIEDPIKRQETLKKMIEGVNRSTHIVQQLLTLSRVSPTAQPKHEELVDLNKICAETAAHLTSAAMNKNITLSLERADGDCWVLGNKTSLGILVSNLVDNAIRYTPENGNVELFVESTNKHVMIRVVDNGPGIPTELRSRVFERFYRVLGNKSPGSGLGLAIVQQIADTHGAKLILDKPSTHEGLSVLVTFPRAHTKPSNYSVN